MLRCAMLCCAMLFCAMLCVPDVTFSGINVALSPTLMLLQQGFFLHSRLFAFHAKPHYLKGVQNKPETCFPVLSLCYDRIGNSSTGQRAMGKFLTTAVLPSAQRFATLLAIFIRRLRFFVHIEGLQRKLTFTTLANTAGCRLFCR